MHIVAVTPSQELTHLAKEMNVFKSCPKLEDGFRQLLIDDANCEMIAQESENYVSNSVMSINEYQRNAINSETYIIPKGAGTVTK